MLDNMKDGHTYTHLPLSKASLEATLISSTGPQYLSGHRVARKGQPNGVLFMAELGLTPAQV